MESKKDYKAGTYTTKKPRKNKTGKICPVCSGCKDKAFCKNRRNVKLMKKCPDCKECSDVENCDTFYITVEHRVVIPIGKDIHTGETIRKSFSGKTEAEAIYKSVQYQKDVENGVIEPVTSKRVYSVISIMKDYEDNMLKNGLIKENTYHRYMETLERIKKADWAYKPITDIAKQEIQDFLSSERELANSTIKKDFNMIKSAFDIALDKELITKKQHHFLGKLGIVKPKSYKRDKKVKALQLNEQRKLINYLKKNDVKHKNIILLCLHTGMRIGEALALQVLDVLFDKDGFYIQRTITQDKNGHTILGETTKNSNGERWVPFNDITRPIMENAIKIRNNSDSGLIFCKEDGEVYSVSAINSAIKRVCKNAGITEPISTHTFRHTYITRAKESRYGC